MVPIYFFTKNVNHKIYEKHARKFLQNKESGSRMKVTRLGRVLEISLTFLQNVV
jgi:hypothetical protein